MSHSTSAFSKIPDNPDLMRQWGTQTSSFDHEDSLVENMDAEGITHKRDSSSMGGLESLAFFAEREIKKQRQTGELDQFWEIVGVVDENCDEQLFEEIAELCSVDLETLQRDSSVLGKHLSKEEVRNLIQLFRWFYLLKMGDLPGHTPEEVKKILGINYFVEMIIPEQRGRHEERSGQWSVGYLSTLLEFYAKNKGQFEKSSSSECYKVLTAQILSKMLASLETEQLFNIIESYFEFEDSEYLDNYQEYFDHMDINSKLRWLLFASVGSNQLPVSREGLTGKPGIWPSTIPKVLLPLVMKIDERIIALSNDTHGGEGSGAGLSFSSQPFGTGFNPSLYLPRINLGVSIPGLPNWMPNGGNSCYISSTLWPLFLLDNEDILKKTRQFLEGGHTDEEMNLKNAKIYFCQLYLDLASPEKKSITTAHINNLRLTLQRVFPDHFSAPESFAQEDAYEFLVCILQSLWNLDSCSSTAPKFQVLHKFRCTEERGSLVDPEHYNYEEALLPAYSSEPTPLVNIRLAEGTMEPVKLKDLVTTLRHTEQVERSAYRKEGWDQGPKYYSVNAEHDEILVVESKEKAPKYFIGHLARFHQDIRSGHRRKRFDVVVPNASLEFHIKGQEEGGETVAYDLTAITIHSGRSIDNGHYYTYIRKKVEGQWKFYKFDDLTGTSECYDEQSVVKDAAKNGYIFYYTKRGADEIPPAPLAFETEMPALFSTSSSRYSSSSSLEKKSFPKKDEGVERQFSFQPSGMKALDFQTIRTLGTPPVASDLRTNLDPNSSDFLNRVLSELGSSKGGSWAEVPKMGGGFDFSIPVQGKRDDSPAVFEEHKKRKTDLSAAVTWVMTMLSKQFSLSHDAKIYHSLPELFAGLYGKELEKSVSGLFNPLSEKQILEAACFSLHRAVYVLDLKNDRDLQVIDGYPIPGDSFRFGEGYSEHPILYLYRNSDGTYVEVKFTQSK